MKGPVMDGYFELDGTMISLSSIKSFRVVQKEYVYRPAYKEKEGFLSKAFSNKKYEFTAMQPYAAIVDEESKKLSLSGFKPGNFKESVGRDLALGVIETIGDKFNMKAIRSKKYHMVTSAGREFWGYLEDIPALVLRNDGRFIDVRSNDEIYPQLGEPITPAVNVVHALMIEADEKYIFYGSGIQSQDISADYERLKAEIAAFRASEESASVSMKKERLKLGLPKMPVSVKEVLSAKKKSKQTD